jgi:hypothetical protein
LHPERSGNPDPATEETTVPLAVAKMCGFYPKPPSGSPRDHKENEMRKVREIVVRTDECEAEPGEGWQKLTRFVEVDGSIVEMFRTNDESKGRGRRVKCPLHWRAVVRYGASG